MLLLLYDDILSLIVDYLCHKEDIQNVEQVCKKLKFLSRLRTIMIPYKVNSINLVNYTNLTKCIGIINGDIWNLEKTKLDAISLSVKMPLKLVLSSIPQMIYDLVKFVHKYPMKKICIKLRKNGRFEYNNGTLNIYKLHEISERQLLYVF